jgi:PAS domain S-box-containing protein
LADLDLVAAGVMELRVDEQRLRPYWRAFVPQQAPKAPTLAQFQRLAARYKDSASELLTTLRETVGAPRATVVPLKVAPRIAAKADAIAIVFHQHPTPGVYEAAQLAQLVSCLEVGLSENRHQRIAATLYAAVDAAPDAIELTDHTAQLIYANPAWERHFGFEWDEVVGRTVGSLFRDPVDPLHDTAFYEFTLNALAEGKPWLGALACRDRHGNRAFCEVSVSPFAAPAQHLSGNFAIRRDMSHRAERERAMAEAYREFRAVLSAVPEGIVILDCGQVAFANPAFLQFVNASETEVVGREYLDFVHEDDRDKFSARGGSGVIGLRFEPRAGPPRYAEISTAGVVSFGGSVASVLVCRDTTEQRLAQEQLARAERLAALGEMAGGIAHEINNPLSYVALNLDQLRAALAQKLAAHELEVLDEAIAGVSRICDTIGGLGTFSKIDDDRPREAINVEQAVTAAVNIVQNEIRHRAKLKREHEPGLSASAREGQLVQLLVNLLLNSAQAIVSPDIETQEIAVVSRSIAPDSVQIIVSDSGSGIAPELVDSVFEPFVTSKGNRGGSGLGLAISKRIVAGLGGRIQLESERGKGTVVTVELPRAVGTTTWVSGVRPAADVSCSKSAKILVVDDEPALARALRRLLRSHDVVVASDGSAALELLEKDANFDVILCDVMMPGVSGFALYREIERSRPELSARFLFMTGGAFTEGAQTFLERSTAQVLKKPLDPQLLLAEIDRMMRGARTDFDASDVPDDPAAVAEGRKP